MDRGAARRGRYPEALQAREQLSGLYADSAGAGRGIALKPLLDMPAPSHVPRERSDFDCLCNRRAKASSAPDRRRVGGTEVTSLARP
jgi:hypothetical protein